MTLNQYISENKLTDAAFAARVGVSQSQINRVRRGVCSPSWPLVTAIIKATGGAVTADDFVVETAA